MVRCTPRPALAGIAMVLLLAEAMTASVTAAQSPETVAATFAHPGFAEVWRPVDGPVAAGAVQRSWVWGPAPFTPGLHEPYVEAPGGQRLVQYFDKGRLELTDPNGPVTAGLLGHELVSGQAQMGDDSLRVLGPAAIPVAGDVNDPAAPTYASFAVLLGRLGRPAREPITRTLTRDGRIGEEPALARHGVITRTPEPEFGLRVASVFEDYLAGEGQLARPGGLVRGRLFEPWWRVAGLPITEAAWVRAHVGGQPRDILVQVFERRVLTYTPDNPPDWRVEMGNIGRHYYQWRYAPGPSQPAAPMQLIGPSAASDASVVAADPAPTARSESAYVEPRSFEVRPVTMTG